jgi:hypothetical protein
MERYGADLVVGSKRHPRSEVRYPWTRKLLSLGYRLVIKSLFRLSVKDTQVGLKLIRRPVLEKALPLMEVTRYAFDLELMTIAKRHGFRIIEAPIVLDFQKPFARLGLKDIYVIFVNTLSIFRRLRKRAYDGDLNVD